MSRPARVVAARSVAGRWWPAVLYPVLLLAASLAVAARPEGDQQALLLRASTNLDNLADHPVRVLALSAFLSDGDALAWSVLAAAGIAGVVAAAGPWRAVVVAGAAHLLGTAVSEGLLGVRIARGVAPVTQRGILDVGPSFVVVGVLVTTVVAGARWWWRALALAGLVLVAPSLFDGLLDGDVAAVGHVTAIVVGLLAGGVVVLRGRRGPASGQRLTVQETRG
jgi:hypothetical protein